MGFEVLEKVRLILSEQFEYDEDSITAETRLVEDLGADSLDVVDLVMLLEDEFEISIPDADIENVKFVRDVVSFVESSLS